MRSAKPYERERDSDCSQPDWPPGLYRRGSSFRFRRVLGGERLMEVWGDIPVADAIRRAQRYNLDIEDGRDPVAKARRESLTFAGFCTEWLGLKAAGLRPKSLVRYRAMVDRFGQFLAECKGRPDVQLASVSEPDASAYVQWRTTTPIMPNGQATLTPASRRGAAKKTVHSEVATLRQLFKAALRRRLIAANPFDEIKVAKPKKSEVAAKHHALTMAEEEALIRAAAEVDAERQYGERGLQNVFRFLTKTGLREAELRNLEWSDVLWDQGLIRLRDKDVVETRTVDIPGSAVPALKHLTAGRPPEARLFRNEGEMDRLQGVLAIRERAMLGAIRVQDVDLEHFRVTATRRYQWRPKATQGDIPMCRTVREMLEHLRKTRTSNFVFAHRDGGSCRLQLWEMVKECQKRAGIPGNLRLHDLRHTFAVRLRQRGTPLEVIMGLMRHSDIRETLIYAPYNVDEGMAAVQVLDRES